jgi:ligand-binding SRPBCC domain-containing protein
MPAIYLTTEINAPVQRCFDLSRSIDLHILSTQKTHEKAVAGITSGLINLNEEVTWRARHFGIWQLLTTRITAFNSPLFFEDKMVKGVFKKMEHQHFFEQQGLFTIMKDQFYFEAPFGIIGIIFSKCVLVHYLRSFLRERNELIKKVAESSQWKSILPNNS